MAEPKKRLTSARSGARRSHLYDKAIYLSKCPKCNHPVISHRVCPNCGTYRDFDVLKLEEKQKAKEERRKAHEEDEKGVAK